MFHVLNIPQLGGVVVIRSVVSQNLSCFETIHCVHSTEYLHGTYIANGDARMLHANSLQMQPLEGHGLVYEVDPSVQRSDAMISGMRIAMELFLIPRVKDRPQGVWL